jgi:PCO_ADO
MRIDRRSLLKAPMFLATPLIFKKLVLGAATDFEEFTTQAGRHALEMILDPNRNEEEYLLLVASLAAGIKQFPPAVFNRVFKTMRAGMSYRGSGIAVIPWRMEPNTVYPAHNHPGYNGLTLGLEGECRMRNFNVVGNAPDMHSKQSFLVRETQYNVLRPGTVTSIMSTARDNIHEIEVGSKGVTAVDIIAKVGPDAGFSFLRISGKPKEPRDRVYEAKWDEHNGNGV